MKPLLPTLSIFCTSLLLVACGGGGGSNFSDTVVGDFSDSASIVVDGGTATVRTSDGTLINLRKIPTPASAPDNFEYPYGFLAVDITGIEPGSSVTLRVELPDVQSDDLFVKCDAEDICAALAGSETDGNAVEFSLTDGGASDLDGLENGTIRDPGALARKLLDSDEDGVFDISDNCPNDANPNQSDADEDGIGDACDAPGDSDSDNDGVLDGQDNCPAHSNPNQSDQDADGLGDACDDQDDTDSDNDTIRDEVDNCPNNANLSQTDTDNDSVGDACDLQDNRDNDNDGVDNFEDNCPDDANADQADSDKDGIGNICEDEPPLETVLRSGDIKAVAGYDPKTDLINAAITENIALDATMTSLVQGIFGSNPISYEIDNRTGYFVPLGLARKANGQIPFLLQSGGRLHAMAGQYKTEFARYSLFGTNVPKVLLDGGSSSFAAPFRRLIAWLLGDNPGAETTLSSTINVLVARSHDTSDVVTWLQQNLPNATVTSCSNTNELASCTAGVNLIVLGKNARTDLLDADVIEIDRLLRAGVPTLYLHTSLEHATGGSIAYSGLFGTSLPSAGNFFINAANSNAVWDDSEAMISELRGDSDAINTVLAHARDGDFSFDFNAGLSGSTVDSDNVPGYEEEFERGASALRSQIRAMDSANFRAFETPVADNRRERAYALIGDRLREDAVFPMDILESDQNAFLSSLLADHLVYNNRTVSAIQPDRGFHGTSDHSQVTPRDYSVSIPTRFFDKKPTGAYVLPGQAFTVTRTDNNSDINVELFWNLQSSGAVFHFRTHESQDHYNQPKYLQTQRFDIDPGETLRLVSPYGGVVHIDHSRTDAAGLTIDLDFTDVGNHPFYNGPDTAAAFTAAMSAGDYEWAEINTPETYVTEPTNFLQNGINNLATRFGWDIDEIARVATVYYYNGMFSLSGYIGFDIPARSTQEQAVCTSKGWECDNTDIHGVSGGVEGNIRQYITNCGSFGGCSNQPVTYTWLWDPIGAGPVHERGHHLERNSGAEYHRFAPFQVHQLTNTWRAALPYFYYRDTGGEAGGNTGACGIESREHRTNGNRYTHLQAARNSGDTVTYMRDNVWQGSESNNMNRAMITQLAAHAADQGGFTEGWDYLPLLLTVAREFQAKLEAGEEEFNATRSRYGFGTYSHAEASELISTRDGQRSWALIAYSVITNKDQRNYWTMLGWDFTTKAATQVAALTLLPAAEQFYAFDDVCSIADAIAVPVDGTSEWPEDRPTVFGDAGEAKTSQKMSPAQNAAEYDDSMIEVCAEHGVVHIHP